MSGERIPGWKLPEEARQDLLQRLPPRYASVVADHVTFKPGGDGAPAPEADHGVLIGHADDGAGVEALVVAINGSTDRPDGSIWHITWSLADGRKPKESNDVIARCGWNAVAEQIRIPLRWTIWERD